MTKPIRLFSVFILLGFTISRCGPEMNVPADFTLDISECNPEFLGEHLNIMSWDLDGFPISESTVEYSIDIINSVNPDIIAVQGIANAFALSRLLEGSDLKALLYSGNSDESLFLGYIYNPNAVSISFLSSEFENDTNFSRPPVKCEVRHLKSGEEVVLFNLHLDCCSEQDVVQKRVKGLRKFKEYLDEAYSETPVVVLGNFIDAIEQSGNINSIASFSEDVENYRIADSEVAYGNPTRWSNPQNNIHSDHIIISNELFESVVDVNTIGLDICIENYFELVSSHLPLYISLDL